MKVMSSFVISINPHYPWIRWNNIRPSIGLRPIRCYATGNENDKGRNIRDIGERLLECYRVLDLPQTCTKEELKSRYLDLAKRYHPDTGGPSADVEAFRRLHSAYKFIVDNDYGASDRSELENVPKVFDIRHTAPQHRQYLEYGGVGHGTPSQRLRQYQQHRVQQASENVKEYMVNKLMANEHDYSLITKTAEEREYARKWKTRSAIDRLVEDLIQESMRRGEFENLSGAGKPLPYDSYNPYLDAMTNKLNQVLIQNGFCPEWVLLEKEIRCEMNRIKTALKEALEKVSKDPYNIQHPEQMEQSWKDEVARLRNDCTTLNKQIDNFNLLVPSLHKQMVHFALDKEIKKITAKTTRTDGSGQSSSGDAANRPMSDQKENVHSTDSGSSASAEKNDSQKKDKPSGIFRMLLDALTNEKPH